VSPLHFPCRFIFTRASRTFLLSFPGDLRKIGLRRGEPRPEGTMKNLQRRARFALPLLFLSLSLSLYLLRCASSRFCFLRLSPFIRCAAILRSACRQARSYVSLGAWRSSCLHRHRGGESPLADPSRGWEKARSPASFFLLSAARVSPAARDLWRRASERALTAAQPARRPRSDRIGSDRAPRIDRPIDRAATPPL